MVGQKAEFTSAKTRIQASTRHKGETSPKGMFSLLLSILKEEGIAGYYRGFTATMINTFSMRAYSTLIEQIVTEGFIQNMHTSSFMRSYGAPISNGGHPLAESHQPCLQPQS